MTKKNVGSMSDREEEDVEMVANSSEEEEGADEYEMDGFVVEHAEEEEENAEKEAKKRKRFSKRDLELDKDDLSLIEENTGEKIKSKKKFKRLKRGTADDDDAEIAENLFGGDSDKEEVGLSSSSDEGEVNDDNWIVDENNEPVRRSGQTSSKGKRIGTYPKTHQLSQATDIFGEGIEDLLLNVEDEEEEETKKQHYEPSLLAEKFFTSADDKIRNTDIPERLQLRFIEFNKTSPKIPSKDQENDESKEESFNVPPTISDAELHREAEWIFNRVFANSDGMQSRSAIPKIISVLEFIKRDFFEIPFIAQYRKEYFRPDFRPKDLWSIYDWDAKYIHLISRKNKLRTMYGEIPDLEEELLNLLDLSQTDQEVKDLYDHFYLHYNDRRAKENGDDRPDDFDGLFDVDSTTAKAAKPKKYKRPVRRDFYTVCKRAGICEFANKQFGLTAKQFGDNLMNNFLTNVPNQPDQEPDSLAADFLMNSREFDSESAVLRACRFVLAKELAFDPHVRQSLRANFCESATVTTVPTFKGKKEIDRMHPFRGIKRLRNKPVAAFQGTDFLRIIQAEKQGLLRVVIGLTKEDHETYFLAEMEPLYLSDSVSLLAEKWNEQRSMILRSALADHLFPIFRQELRQDLINSAHEAVFLACVKGLKKKIFVSPYQRSSAPGRPVRAAGCIWADGDQPSWCVVVDTDGQLLDHMRLDYVNIKTAEAHTQLEPKLVEFLNRTNPKIILIGATPGELGSRELCDIVVNATRDRLITSRIDVSFYDSAVARIYRNSDRGKAEYPNVPDMVRQGICLARCAQDPLEQFASLCNDEDEILCLKLHRLQPMVSKDTLRERLERVFIEAVNLVGVDVNKAILQKHSQATIQFLCGLGPRKAKALISALERRGGMVTSREDLESFFPQAEEEEDSSRGRRRKQDITKMKVYMNSCGFMRILGRYFKDTEFDVLDDTRIHPMDYEIARQMVADALESNEPASHWQYLVKELMQQANRLEEIDLDQFAEEWERSGRGKKALTLYDIKEELADPYGDPRKKWKKPSHDELFTMLTGETKETLRRGTLVTARVTRVDWDMVNCTLDNGIDNGRIPKMYLTDRAINQCSEIVNVGQTLSCRVLDVNRALFEVVLTSRGRDLKEMTDGVTDSDTYLVEGPATDAFDTEFGVGGSGDKLRSPKRSGSELLSMISGTTMLGTNGTRTPSRKKKRNTKMVNHPLFKNYTYKEAEEELADCEAGEGGVVIRPSSRAKDHLTISWKFQGKIVNHTDVTEKTTNGKKTFIVKEKEYEDLDEIIYRYIIPITDHAKAIEEFRYFKDGDQAAIDKRLHADKEVNPTRIPYFIGECKEYPSKFMLYYMPGSRAKHEYITVLPSGFRFRNRIFKTPDRLIAWFKVHFKDPPRSSSRSGRSSSRRSSSSSSGGNHSQHHQRSSDSRSRSSRDRHRSSSSAYGNQWG